MSFGIKILKHICNENKTLTPPIEPNKKATFKLLKEEIPLHNNTIKQTSSIHHSVVFYDYGGAAGYQIPSCANLTTPQSLYKPKQLDVYLKYSLKGHKVRVNKISIKS